MAIYDFGLLVGYRMSGVDVAQGFRAKVYANNNIPIKFLLFDVPTQRELKEYNRFGIQSSQMLIAQEVLLDREDIVSTVSYEECVNRLKKVVNYDVLLEQEEKTVLYRQNKRVAEIIVNENHYVDEITYCDEDHVLASEHFADGLLYSDLFENNRIRRSFVNKNGNVIFEQYIQNNTSYFVFANGEKVDLAHFWIKVIQKLNLTKEDICILDRASYFEFTQPLFTYGRNARIICVLHSDQYYKRNEDIGSLYMNYEYYYWFKYSRYIDTFVVGTKEQKESLTSILNEHHQFVPEIEVIAPGALQKLQRENFGRKPNSILTVSRLDKRKQIDILIKSVVEAYKSNPRISLDIYGGGNEEYTNYLKNLVTELDADEYIRFMGYMDVSHVYKNYEMYASVSLWETFGLSLMEAIGSGTAMIGLDVRYGNRLFIKNGENGYLIDFDVEKDLEKESMLQRRIADKIVDVFRNEQWLREAHEKSYEIAEQFLYEKTAQKWIDLVLK